MSKINLIPEVRQQKLKVQKTNNLVTTIAIMIAFIIVGIIIVLAIYVGILKKQENDIDGKIVTVQNNLDTMKDLEATVANLESGLSNIKGIIAGGKDWNDLFNVFEKFTPSDIQITSLVVKSSDATLSLKGKDVGSIDRFISSITNAKNNDDKNYFDKVLVSGYSREMTGTGVTFEAKITLNEAAIW